MKTVTIYTDGIKTALRFYAGCRFCSPLAGQPQNMTSKRRRIGAL